jgi:hypothetical protein
LQAQVVVLQAEVSKLQVEIKSLQNSAETTAQMPPPAGPRQAASNMIDTECAESLNIDNQVLRQKIQSYERGGATRTSGAAAPSKSMVVKTDGGRNGPQRVMRERTALKAVNFASPVESAKAGVVVQKAGAEPSFRAEKRDRISNRVEQSPKAVSAPKRRSPQPLSLNDGTLDAEDEGAAECAQQ